MARLKTITTQVTEETWQAVADAGNLWGESMSRATDRLVQRGLISLSTELGSKTPIHIRLARIEEELRVQESSEQRVINSYNRAIKLGDFDKVKEVQELALKLKVELTDMGP